MGSGTVRLCTPQRPLRATVFQHLPGGAGPGVSGSDPPEPGDLSKVKAPQVPPGWAAARLRLRCAFPLHQDHPGDTFGHLEKGRRLRTSSDWAGWGGGSTCCGSRGLSRPAPRCRHRGDWQRKVGAGMQRNPNVLKCRVALLPQFPAVERGELQDGQGSETLISGSWAGAGQGRRAAPGSPRGDTHRVGGLGLGGGLGLRAEDKAAAPPRSPGQWNEWAINSGQWAARVAPLKSRGSGEQPLFACAAPGVA